MKSIKYIAIATLLCLIVFLGITCYLVEHHPTSTPSCATPSYFVCGNATQQLSADALQGKAIFNSNCAACHHKYRKMTGPILATTDSLVFVKWLTDTRSTIDTTKMEAMVIDYHKVMFGKRLHQKEVTQLIAYCKSN